MTYPQTPASKYVTADGQFWRLNTLLASPGDIYESDVGLNALAVGPNSDISRVQVSYYDSAVPTSLLNEVTISPDRSMVGLVSSRLDQNYPLTALAGRILVAPADIWDPNYTPSTATPNDVVSRLIPRLDVIGYFNNPPSLVPQRSDNKVYITAFAPAGAGPSYSWLVVPYYGRKYACVSIRNYSVADITYQLRGVRYTTVVAEPDETQLVAAGAVVVGATNVYRVRASADGMFDALVLGVLRTGGSSLFKVYTTVYMSDDPL